jgi:hypothetical protein
LACPLTSALPSAENATERGSPPAAKRAMRRPVVTSKITTPVSSLMKPKVTAMFVPSGLAARPTT